MVAMTAQPSAAARQIVAQLFALLVATTLSIIPVIQNLISRKQIMNTGFDPLRRLINNSYGAFGTVDENREEFIISAAFDLDSSD
jgi:hypothetical protein